MNDTEQAPQVMMSKGMIKIGSAAECEHLQALGKKLQERQSIRYES